MTGEKPRRIPIAAAVLFCTACVAPDVPPSGAVTPPAATRPAETVTLGRAIAPSSAPDDYRAGWASVLIGEPVIDPRGSHLGLLNDFVFESRTGAVRYAIVSDKRTPGMERLVAVPLRLLHVTGQEGLLLDIARERFDRQPLAAREPAHTHRVSRLMGRYANDRDGRHAGRIVDVVLDLDRGAVHYAVLRLQGHAGVRPDHAFAVPVESLKLDGGRGRVQLAVPRAYLMRLVGTDGDEAPPDTLRYLGVVDRDFGVAFPREARGPRSGVGATR